MSKLFWLDMEMSGLLPQTDRILEVALVITDKKLNILHSYENVIYQEKNILDSMNDWCMKHHVSSGLYDRVMQGKAQSEVEQELCDITQKYLASATDKRAILAGNSIHQDRKFIDIWMPKLAGLLHYRMLDVSSFKLVFDNISQKKFIKQKRHRAIDDILESIEELKYYLQYIKI